VQPQIGVPSTGAGPIGGQTTGGVGSPIGTGITTGAGAQAAAGTQPGFGTPSTGAGAIGGQTGAGAGFVSPQVQEELRRRGAANRDPMPGHEPTGAAGGQNAPPAGSFVSPQVQEELRRRGAANRDPMPGHEPLPGSPGSVPGTTNNLIPGQGRALGVNTPLGLGNNLGAQTGATANTQSQGVGVGVNSGIGLGNNPGVNAGVDSRINPAGVNGSLNTQTGVNGVLNAQTGATAQTPQFHNGFWWYRLGNGNWVFNRNGGWFNTNGTPYVASATAGSTAGIAPPGAAPGTSGATNSLANADSETNAGATTPPAPPTGTNLTSNGQMQFHNGRSWYPTNDGWLYFDKGAWLTPAASPTPWATSASTTDTGGNRETAAGCTSTMARGSIRPVSSPCGPNRPTLPA